MAIAYDNASSVAANAGSGGCSWSHTIGSGSNRVLLMALVFQEQESSPTTITATYNSVAMTAVGRFNSGQYDRTLALYIMKEADLPSAGSYTVAFSFGATEYYAGGGAVSFSNVDQTTAAHNYAEQYVEATASQVATFTVTSAANEVAVAFMCAQCPETVTDNNTNRWNRWDATGTLQGHGGSSKAGAASTEFTWTFGGTSEQAYYNVGASLKDAADSTDIVLGNTAQSGEATDYQTAFSFDHTLSAGSNRAVFVAIAGRQGGTGFAPSAPTYGGTAMTPVRTHGWSTASGFAVGLWVIKEALTTGVNAVAWTASDSDAVSYGLCAVEYDGVDQTTPFTGATSANGGDASPTLTITSVTGDIVIAVNVMSGDPATNTFVGDQTEVIRNTVANGNTHARCIVQSAPGAASVVVSATQTPSTWVEAGASITRYSVPVSEDGFIEATRVYTP